MITGILWILGLFYHNSIGWSKLLLIIVILYFRLYNFNINTFLKFRNFRIKLYEWKSYKRSWEVRKKTYGNKLYETIKFHYSSDWTILSIIIIRLIIQRNIIKNYWKNFTSYLRHTHTENGSHFNCLFRRSYQKKQYTSMQKRNVVNFQRHDEYNCKSFFFTCKIYFY